MRGARLNASTPAVVLKLVPELFHHGGLGFVRSLGRLGVPVYGVHDTLRAPAAYSRYAAGRFVWDGSADDPVEFLRGMAESIGERAVLVPQDDVSTEVVDENSAELGEWFLFPERSPELVRALSNKREMNRLCREHGVPTAETVFPTSDEEFERFLDDATFPIVLKGAESWVPGTRTSARLAIAASRDEVVRIWAEMSPAERSNTMLQEYIPGGPDTVWMFNGYFDARSDCLVAFTGRKLRQSPPYTGMTCLGVCLPNPDVAQTTTRFMKEIGYRGVLDIGYRYDARDGLYKLLDVNPRLGATFRLFVDPERHGRRPRPLPRPHRAVGSAGHAARRPEVDRGAVGLAFQPALRPRRLADVRAVGTLPARHRGGRVVCPGRSTALHNDVRRGAARQDEEVARRR